ncbi:hypothetical protein P5673_001632 [Acropora cervicornis]|uniref:Reverse transcriptase domain-containing protein n=1 Tax=Acropora cervicornis TaxID=6130 RepID=A0AAD9VG34_ACRCE|nr:hypothetical protein P5673_001632 [Acropora cervicornis]
MVGFTAGRSCVTQLVEVLDIIGSHLDNGCQINTVYLDMSKAFDRVSHQKLINKLRQNGFGGNIFQSKKCKIMHTTRKRKRPESAYHLGGSPLVCTKTEKDLGVCISDNLSWSKQVSEACSRANRPLGFVRRNSRTIRNARIRQTYIHTCFI